MKKRNSTWNLQRKFQLFYKGSGDSQKIPKKRPLEKVSQSFKLSPLTHSNTKPSPRTPEDSDFGSLENWVETRLEQMLFVSTSLTRLWTHHGRALISPSAGSQLHDSFIHRRERWRGSTSLHLRSRWCHMLSVTLHHDSLGCFHSHTICKPGGRGKRNFSRRICWWYTRG